MIIIELDNNKIKLVSETPNIIKDKRTQREYYEVICRKDQLKNFEEVTI